MNIRRLFGGQSDAEGVEMSVEEAINSLGRFCKEQNEFNHHLMDAMKAFQRTLENHYDVLTKMKAYIASDSKLNTTIIPVTYTNTGAEETLTEEEKKAIEKKNKPVLH